jgi:S-formylglutathione hydrolase FrmB
MKRALVAIPLVLACSSSSRPKAPPVEQPDVAKVEPSNGEVRTAKLSSAALGADKAYVVYLPAGYDTSDRRYPVIYMLHGLGGDETNWVGPGSM